MGLTRIRAEQVSDIDYKQAVRVISTSNVNLSGGTPSTVDGVSLNVNDRILVTGQTTSSQNGLYYVTTVGSGSNGTWTRTNDGNVTGEINAGMIVMVTEGVTWADTSWKLVTDNPIVIGTTSLVFLQNTGNSFSIINVVGSSNVVANGVSSQVSFVSGNNISITGNNAADTITFDVSESPSFTGNVTGGNILTAGLVSATGNLYGNNIITTGTGGGISGTGNIIGGNLLTSGFISVTGNAYVGNLINLGSSSSTGNITGGNILTAGLISATGNITGNYFIGNGSLLTGVEAANANANSIIGNTLSSNVVNSSLTTVGTLANLSVSGNINTSGNISITGNVTGNYIFGNGINLTGLANVTFDTSPPGNAIIGDIWIDSNSGTQYIYFNDVAGYVWAEMEAQTSYSSSGYANLTTNTTNTQILYNASNAIVGSNNLRFDGTTLSAQGLVVGQALQVTANSIVSSTNNSNLIINTTGSSSYINLTGGLSVLSYGGNKLIQTVSDTINFYTPILNSTDSAIDIIGSIDGNLVSPQTTGVMFHISGQPTLPSRIYNDGANSYSAYIGRMYNGNASAPSQILANTIVTRFGATPYGNAGWPALSTTRIDMVTTENQTTTNQGTRLEFWTTSTGSNTIAQVMSLTNANMSVTGNIITSGTISANSIVNAGTGNLYITGNILPSSTSYNLGLPTVPWQNAYFGSQSITILDTVSGNLANSVTIENANGAISMGTEAFIIGSLSNNTPVFTIAAISGQIFSNANTIIQNNTNSANTTSGSLQTAGGAGIAKNLYVGGNIYGGNLSVSGITVDTGNITGNYFIGNGSQLTSITGANVTGNIANATYATSAGTASTVIANAQPNITSVGTLTSITSSGLISTTGNVTGNYIIGNGSLLTGLAATYGNSNVANYLPTYSGNLGNVGTITATGNIVGNYLIGNGSQLTGITAVNSGFPITAGNSNISATTNSNIAVSIGGTSNIAVFANTGMFINGNLSVSGTVNFVPATYGTFANTASITAATNNTPAVILWNTAIANSGVTYSAGNSRIIVTKTGTYNFTYTAMFSGNGGSPTGYVWLRLNGTDVANSMATGSTTGSVQVVISGGAPISVTANQYVEVVWAVDNKTNGNLVSSAANSGGFTHPASPSVTLTVMPTGV